MGHPSLKIKFKTKSQNQKTNLGKNHDSMLEWKRGVSAVDISRARVNSLCSYVTHLRSRALAFLIGVISGLRTFTGTATVACRDCGYPAG